MIILNKQTLTLGGITFMNNSKIVVVLTLLVSAMCVQADVFLSTGEIERLNVKDEVINGESSSYRRNQWVSSGRHMWKDK